MCSTCDYTKYIEAEKDVRGKTAKYLKADNERMCLDIKCNIDGRNFNIGAFTIYRCPTCGRKLF